MTTTQIAPTRGARPLSFDIDTFPVPQGTEEEWRFTPIERLEDFFETATGEGPHVSVTGGVRFETVGRDDERLGTIMPPEDRTSVMSWNSFDKAHIVTVPANTVLDEEVIVNITGQGEDAVAAQHVLIDAQPHSEATIVLNHTGSARLNQGVEIIVGEGAHLTFVSVQEFDDDAVFASSNRINVGRNATLKHIVVSLGGDLLRVTASLDYAGEGADVNMLGAYFVDAGQHIENRLLLDHNVPNSTSNVTYKGALQGEDAHSVWIGDVLIRPEGEGTSTYELNRNLILNEGPRADSVPNLEIETGEIEGAGHASTTGRFDDEQLFYLMSRGIPEVLARRLVVRGFFAELVQQIGVKSVEDKLMEAIEHELDLTMGALDG
ncbi:MAG: Fe-S cluster assembly protein SufD [Actinomycetaceae bacterium]|nr:Fe-S cluster assembly protein SufD [Actinomycetaceae bacterium]